MPFVGIGTSAEADAGQTSLELPMTFFHRIPGVGLTLINMELNKDIINYRKETFGGLIINLKTGKIFKLNKTGYKVFLVLYKGIKSKEELIRKLQNDFKGNRNQIKTDVKTFIKKLVENGFFIRK